MAQGSSKWLALAGGLLLFCLLAFSAVWMGLCMFILDVKDPFSKVKVVYVKKTIEQNIAIKPENVEEREFTAWQAPFIYTPQQHSKDVIGRYSYSQLDAGEVVSKYTNLQSQPFEYRSIE
jgi:hypothetical protein